ncbi:MAG: D-glycero-beta-D-manno-heptose 1-phosphate adenylyltransferase [bacterium]
MRHPNDKIFYNWERLKLVIDKYKQVGKIIGFTNGCFDIIHKGHITYLYQAKEYCDLLVVAINSDKSVAKIKGPNKPINTLEDRMIVLASIEAVDFVVPFEEETPILLLEYLRPDVYFKGGDYKGKEIPEIRIIERYRIRYEVLTFVPDISTTKIIYKIKGGL